MSRAIMGCVAGGRADNSTPDAALPLPTTYGAYHPGSVEDLRLTISHGQLRRLRLRTAAWSAVASLVTGLWLIATVSVPVMSPIAAGSIALVHLYAYVAFSCAFT